MRELRERSERHHQRRLVEDTAAEVFRLDKELAWERLLVTGDEQVTARRVVALPDRLRSVAICDARRLGDLDPAGLATVAGDRFESERAHRDDALAHELRDAALGGGLGALGRSEVVAALNEARVEHLVYDPDLRYVGGAGTDDLLYADGERAASSAREPRLTSRIVERTLLTRGPDHGGRQGDHRHHQPDPWLGALHSR